jgi:hypothetical protein
LCGERKAAQLSLDYFAEEVLRFIQGDANFGKGLWDCRIVVRHFSTAMKNIEPIGILPIQFAL